MLSNFCSTSVLIFSKHRHLLLTSEAIFLRLHSFPFRLRLPISMVFLRRKVENLSQVRLMPKNIIFESDISAVNLIVVGGTCLPVLQILLLCVWLCPTHRKCRHNTSSKQAV